MKSNRITTFFVFLLMCVSYQTVHAQFKLGNLIKKTEQQISRKLDSTIEKKADKAFKKVDGMLSTEPDKMEKTSGDNSQSTDYIEYESVSSQSPAPVLFDRYSKFDFIPGSEVLFYDDFKTSSIGDIPKGWNFSGGVELVNLSHLEGNWLQVGRGKNTLVPPIKDIPENFTLEFDLVFDYDPAESTYARYVYVLFSDHENPNSKLSTADVGNNFFRFAFVGGANGRGLQYVKKASDATLNDRQRKDHPYTQNKNNTKRGEVIKVSFWKTNNRMRVYLDEQKVYDVPRAFEDDVNLATLRFWTELSADNQYFFINNIRLAKSEATIQYNLSSDGVYSSQGIYFDSGSSTIKPESYATLQQMSQYIKSNSKSFLIVGHTDSDGDIEANRLLSQQRGAAVREVLVSEFGVDTNLLASGGFGSKYPIASNTTAIGKAQNRRVDFINLSVKSSENYEAELFKNSITVRN